MSKFKPYVKPALAVLGGIVALLGVAGVVSPEVAARISEVLAQIAAVFIAPPAEVPVESLVILPFLARR